MMNLAHGTLGERTVPSIARVQNTQSFVMDLQGNVCASRDLLAKSVRGCVLQEHMATIAVRHADAKTMQAVQDKMAPVTAPSEGGQGFSAIFLAQGDTMG